MSLRTHRLQLDYAEGGRLLRAQDPEQVQSIHKCRKSSTWQAISGRIFRFHSEVFIWSKNLSLLMDRMNNISKVIPRIHFINLATFY